VLPATADEVSVLSDGAAPVEVPVVDIASAGRRGGGGRAASRVVGERTTRPRRSAAPEAEAEAPTDADDGDETSSAPGRKPARRSSFGGSSFGDGGSRSFGNRSRGGRAGARRPRKEWGIQLDAEVDEPVADTGAAGHAVVESTPPGAEQQHERPRQPARGRAGSFGRPRRAEGEPPPVYEDPEQAARQICLTALTGAARTRRQLADLLTARDIPEDAAEAVLERFAEVGLVDDAAFAAAWVSSRQSARGLSRRALGAELRAKGVDAEVASVALEAVDPQDEWDTARVLVARKVPGMRRLDTATATRRLTAMLSRKGYGAGLAAWVVREALEADGKSEDAAAEADPGPSDASSTHPSDDGPEGPDEPPIRRGLWSGRPLDDEPGPAAEVGEGLGLDGWARTRSARRRPR
jgi:SOS response regulatory protein OraA/RecX